MAGILSRIRIVYPIRYVSVRGFAFSDMGSGRKRQLILGKVLISVSALLTAAYPVVGDWNDKHTFALSWPAHAQFHGAAEIVSAVLLAIAALRLLWRPAKGDAKLSLLVAMLLPLIKWVPFYFAALVPGTSPVNPPHQMFATLGGIPVNQSYPILLAVAGYFLARRDVAEILLSAQTRV